MNLIKSLFGKSDTSQFDDIRSQGALIIDVRSPGEFAGGHMPGAVNENLFDAGSWRNL